MIGHPELHRTPKTLGFQVGARIPRHFRSSRMQIASMTSRPVQLQVKDPAFREGVSYKLQIPPAPRDVGCTLDMKTPSPSSINQKCKIPALDP